MTDEAGERSGGWMFGAAHRRAPTLEPGLHIVATPIGNLRDITIRALDALAAADTVLAEDTRVTTRLLNHYGIKAKLRRFDAHASATQLSAIVAELGGGAALALVSDAGTPLLSDPGAELVRKAVSAGVPVFAVPGASALLTGLVVSGVPADRFFFEGFLPAKSGDRRRRIKAIGSIPGVLVFYEAPHRVEEALSDMLAVLGDRPAAAARELTKLHETVARGTLSSLLELVRTTPPRGEYVLMVGAGEGPASLTDEEIDARLLAAMADMSVKDAAAVVAAETGLPKREAYARALRLQAR
ncbi:MAG: 16S rRNA (cytidine(1402)-2'-O)-methyltransferase [Beijerinckiaceae bacterium]